MKCTNCGHELPNGALFCTRCGQAVQDGSQVIYENSREMENDRTANEEKEINEVFEDTSAPTEDGYTLDKEKEDCGKPVRTFPQTRKGQVKWKETYTIFALIGVLILAVGGGLLYRNMYGKQGNGAGETVISSREDGETPTGNQGNDDGNSEESKEKEEQEAKETDGVEEDVNQIEKDYNEITFKILEGTYSKIILRNGVMVYRNGADVKSVVISKGIDGNTYARAYYYLDGDLIYATYEDTDVYNFYFHNGSLIRWNCMKDASDLQDVETFDMDESGAYSNWEKSIQEESNALKTEVDALSPKGFSMANVVGVSATSVLTERNKVYTASQLIDGDITEAWIEGANGQGINECITVYFDGKYPISGMTIHAGFQRRADLYERNSRPAELRISYADGMSEVYNLQDINGAQIIDFSDTVVTDYVSLSIVSVYPGSEWEDTAISEVSFYSYE